MADKTAGRRKADRIPFGMTDECKDIAARVRHENAGLRYDKIQAARNRIATGYYSSPHVVRIIASRLIEESCLA